MTTQPGTSQPELGFTETDITACLISTGDRTNRTTRDGKTFQAYPATVQTIDGHQQTYPCTSYHDNQLVRDQWLKITLRYDKKKDQVTGAYLDGQFWDPQIWRVAIQTLQVEARIGSVVVPTLAVGIPQPEVATPAQAQVSTPTRPQPQPDPNPQPEPEPEPQPAYYPGPVPWSTITDLRIAWNSAFNNAISWMAAHSERLIDEHGLPLPTDDPLWKQQCQYLTHQFYLVIMNGPDFNRWGPYLYVDEELPGVKLP